MITLSRLINKHFVTIQFLINSEIKTSSDPAQFNSTKREHCEMIIQVDQSVGQYVIIFLLDRLINL